MTARFLAALAALACAVPGAAASAHAFLDHAEPAVGSTVASTPAEITLWFTQELEPAFSGVSVTDAAGQRVDNGTAVLDPRDHTELHVALRTLAPGQYLVRWHVVSVDTHRTEGDFSFTVGR